MNKTIILDAGHSIDDPGAIAGGTTEAKEAIKIRDQLIPLLKLDFNVEVVPDNLNLVQSIAWVNKKFKNLEDGLAFAIHLNAGGGKGYGAEIFYYDGDEKSKEIANTLINKYCNITGFYNRGTKPDTATRHKRLGWIRDVKPWSLLIECCFIDNQEDMKKLREGFDKIALAIYSGICDVFKITTKQV